MSTGRRGPVFGKVGRKCEPGCKCGRHNAPERHKPGCYCRIHREKAPKPARPPRQPKVPKAATERCKCNHLRKNHDAFGCRTCQKPGSMRMCVRYVPKDAIPTPVAKEHDYAKQVAGFSFVAHSREIATCTICWGGVKIGFVHSESCVINAKAHYLKCRQRQANAMAIKRIS